MKYTLRGTFYTDDDFTIDLDYQTMKKFAKHVNMTKQHDESLIEIDIATNDPDYMIGFLEALIMSYRTITHPQVLGHLYKITNELINAMNNKQMKYRCVEMGGNYENTRLILTKDEDCLGLMLYGVKMPEGEDCLYINILPDGSIFEIKSFNKSELLEGKAVEVPAHGDLKDFTAVMKKLDIKGSLVSDKMLSKVGEEIIAAPVVIYGKE